MTADPFGWYSDYDWESQADANHVTFEDEPEEEAA